MNKSNSWRRCAFLKLIGGRTPLALGAIACAGLLHVQPVEALQFGSGEVQGSLDITISHGITYRVKKPNPSLAAKLNNNDGNLNYKRGLVSNTSKFTADLDVGTPSFGAFFRATGFLDFENQNGETERTPLSKDAKRAAVRDIELLDAYVTSSFDVGESAVDVRLGKHVLNWGESTFIPNGINAINPFDVSKLRLPGSELREALLPVSMVSASVVPNQELSFEGFYQLDWEQTRIDPVGTFFSTNDYAGAGAKRAYLTEFLAGIPNADLGDLLFVPRGADRTPANSGQWGVALRYFAEELGQTEFGFYFMNYHSRLPVIGASQSSRDVLSTALGTFNTVNNNSPETIGLATGAAVDVFAKGGQYFLEYPEDVQLTGLSFNTVLGASGWALQGEYSFRHDAPLQRAERNVLADGLAPILTSICLTDQVVSNAVCRRSISPAYGNIVAQQYIDNYSPNSVVGYVKSDVSQIQATGTKVLGPMLGADSSVLVVEAAIMHVHGMPNEAIESPAGGTLSNEESDADATSFGYRVATRLDYNNAIGSVNLFPYAQFLHDVKGNSPAPIGPFIEGRTALTLGLGADYLSSWQGDISYTSYNGKGYDLRDRDFISASIKYSF